jgi:ATP-dependent Lon protease
MSSNQNKTTYQESPKTNYPTILIPDFTKLEPPSPSDLYTNPQPSTSYQQPATKNQPHSIFAKLVHDPISNIPTPTESSTNQSKLSPRIKHLNYTIYNDILLVLSKLSWILSKPALSIEQTNQNHFIRERLKLIRSEINDTYNVCKADFTELNNLTQSFSNLAEHVPSHIFQMLLNTNFYHNEQLKKNAKRNFKGKKTNKFSPY